MSRFASCRRSVLCAVFAAASLSAAGSAAADAVGEVRAVYKECRSSKQANTGGEVRYFAGYASGEPVWSSRLPAGGEVYSEVTFHGRPAQARTAMRFDTSPSGDWTKTHDYCFRRDGTLAFVFAELRTFNGNVRVEDRFYFSPSGRQFRKLRYVFDLETARRLPDGYANFMDRDTTIYLSRRDLLREVAGNNGAAADPPASRDFVDYPAPATDLPASVTVRTDDPQLQAFRQVYLDQLATASRARPNFAGAYVLFEFGCGTACQTIVLVDRRTGDVLFAPQSASAGTTFRPDSRLLVFNPDPAIGLASSGYELIGGRFRKLW